LHHVDFPSASAVAAIVRPPFACRCHPPVTDRILRLFNPVNSATFSQESSDAKAAQSWCDGSGLMPGWSPTRALGLPAPTASHPRNTLPRNRVRVSGNSQPAAAVDLLNLSAATTKHGMAGQRPLPRLSCR